MEKLFGLWVDHEKAIIVSITNGNHQIIHVKSDIEGHLRLKDDSQSISPSNLQGNTIESKMDSRYRKYLNIYFQHIIDALKEAKHIFIFGPGEAKIEFKKRIEKNNILLNKISGIEASDKLTEPQIVAKVKKYFSKE
jgi:hypothetical protein